MEVSPRGGGNRLSEMIRFSTGFDIIDYAVKASMGEPLDKTKSLSYHGYWAEIILHSNKEGNFDRLVIERSISDCVKEIDLWISKEFSVPDNQQQPFQSKSEEIRLSHMQLCRHIDRFLHFRCRGR